MGNAQWDLGTLAGAIGFFVLTAAQIWFGKTINNIGQLINREDKPGVFVYTVCLSIFAGLFLLAIWIYEILNRQ
jgi:hypothetical protein